MKLIRLQDAFVFTGKENREPAFTENYDKTHPTLNAWKLFPTNINRGT